ncbi:DNA-damage-repair/toleration protein DRT100-like protein [Gossypium australe]|uniref:DNA-damage-repair/toleration protein DRT100-like protein n=1 Tax=Gossypium australe TaxID=47621 RepID=A0A5B6VSZ6_9ROSI|nr:DNA-damage-repair/toleration protein DRT100-like protein [Gossypium australe]
MTIKLMDGFCSNFWRFSSLRTSHADLGKEPIVGLRSLNLSGYLLTGNIPNNIGNLELIESLDLSINQLTGEILPSFSNLNFLNYFNVSYNNLTEQIPTSIQLQSFENLSYMDNHLYGPPLTKNCTTKGFSTDITNNGGSDKGSKVNWLYINIVIGFVMRFWGLVTPLFFIESWSQGISFTEQFYKEFEFHFSQKNLIVIG